MSGQDAYIKLEGQPEPQRRGSRVSFFFQYDYADDEHLGSTSEPGQGDLVKVTKQEHFSKTSQFYGKDDFLSQLRESESKRGLEYGGRIARKEAENTDIADAKRLQPDGPQGASAKVQQGGGRGAERSAKTGRMYPTPNKDAMMGVEPIRFLFTKMTNDNMMHLWDLYTKLFLTQCTLVVLYALVFLRFLPYWTATFLFGVPFAWLAIQNVYNLHDVIHGASFPPREWQSLITHCWADLVSVSWEDLVMEHMKHHSSTPDLLEHGEFGWDPAEWLFVLQERWATLPLMPLWHFLGANDTGGAFALMWYCKFPDSYSQLYTKWFWQRIRHQAFLCCLWGAVWLLGTWPMGRPLQDGWRVLLPVTVAARCGFTLAWMVFTNVNHSHMWNSFLARAPERKYPVLTMVMSLILGGPARFNEMLFHDVHHAFPNAVGALSMRGRFNDWRKVHHAGMQVLMRGLYKPEEVDPETTMTALQSRRSKTFKAAGKPGAAA